MKRLPCVDLLLAHRLRRYMDGQRVSHQCFPGEGGGVQLCMQCDIQICDVYIGHLLLSRATAHTQPTRAEQTYQNA